MASVQTYVRYGTNVNLQWLSGRAEQEAQFEIPQASSGMGNGEVGLLRLIPHSYSGEVMKWLCPTPDRFLGLLTQNRAGGFLHPSLLRARG